MAAAAATQLRLTLVCGTSEPMVTLTRALYRIKSSLRESERARHP